MPSSATRSAMRVPLYPLRAKLRVAARRIASRVSSSRRATRSTPFSPAASRRPARRDLIAAGRRPSARSASMSRSSARWSSV